MTIQVPKWLNLDEVVPPEMQAEIPDIAQSARNLVDAVEAFMHNAWPKYHAIATQIETPDSSEDLDGWPQFIYNLTGLAEIEDCIALSEWVLSTMMGGGTADDHAHTIIAKRISGPSQSTFEAFWQREHDRQIRVFGMTRDSFAAEREAAR
ncbi:MAG TPA: hypothetical protein VM282_04040 [Acidimicrobiales bacterium]|nr:hypothetical protein [Acidimicrobiales bacterium]